MLVIVDAGFTYVFLLLKGLYLQVGYETHTAVDCELVFDLLAAQRAAIFLGLPVYDAFWVEEMLTGQLYIGFVE